MSAVPSNPGWATGFTPTAAQWAAAFSAKTDFGAGPTQGLLGSLAVPGNGQIPMGNLGNYTPGTLGTGPGLAITTGAGTLTIGFDGTTGSGSVVLQESPSLVTPDLGVALATSVAMQSGSVVAAPVAANDLANKAYVDGVAQGLNVKAACDWGTAAALPACTYANGASGVGATLTGDANGALTVDGGAVTAGQRILIKNQVAALQNGIYVVTDAGSAGTPFILTRSLDANTGAEVESAYTFIQEGAVNTATGWVNTNTTPPTIGTTAITFTQFSGAGTYTAGTGLTLTGSQFSITNTTVSAGSYTFGSFTVNAQGQLTAASSTSSTGSGAVALATSPTLVTPDLGTPSAAVLTNATGLPISTGLTGLGAANRIPYATSTAAMTTSAGLTFDGTNFATTGSASAASFIPSGSTVPTNGMYLSAANTLAWATNSAIKMTLDANGALGLGITSLTGYNLCIGANLTGATSASSVYSAPTIQSDVTGTATIIYAAPSTQATSFTASLINHFRAEGVNKGAGSTVTLQTAYSVSSGFTQATSNRAFYSDLAASGSANWNLYMNGNAPNYMAGALGIGTTSLGGYDLNITRNITGSTVGGGVNVAAVVQSDVTISAAGFSTSIGTQATAFTAGQIVHFIAQQSTIGAGSTLTAQQGFRTAGSLIGATTNTAIQVDDIGGASATTGKTMYGLRLRNSLASGGGTVWNAFFDGSADNYMAGSLGIGSTSLSAIALRVGSTVTGNTSAHGVYSSVTFASDVTNVGIGVRSTQSTAAASFTLPSLRLFQASQGTIGAGSTVTEQIGYYADSGLTGGTSNYGFYGAIAAGSNRYNLYMAGTADNYLAGDLTGVAGTTGMTVGFTYIPAASGVPSGTPTARSGRVPMYYDTANDNFYIYNGGWKKVALAA